MKDRTTYCDSVILDELEKCARVRLQGARGEVAVAKGRSQDLASVEGDDTNSTLCLRFKLKSEEEVRRGLGKMHLVWARIPRFGIRAFLDTGR